MIVNVIINQFELAKELSYTPSSKQDFIMGEIGALILLVHSTK